MSGSLRKFTEVEVRLAERIVIRRRLDIGGETVSTILNKLKDMRVGFTTDIEKKFTICVIKLDKRLYTGASKRSTYGESSKQSTCDKYNEEIGNNISFVRALKNITIADNYISL